LAIIVDLATPFLYNSILFATGKTRIYAKIHVVFAIVIWTLGFIVCKIGDSVIYYLLLSVFVALMIRVVGLIMASRSIGIPLLKMINLFSILKIVIVSFSIGLASKLLADRIVESQVIGFFVGGGIYVGLLFISDKVLRLNIVNTAFSVLKKEKIE